MAHADSGAARADLGAARSDVATARSEPTGVSGNRSPAPVEPVTMPAATPRSSDGAAPPSDSLELRVSYRAPRECPSSSAFLAALQQHVAAGGGGAIDADVSLAHAGPSQFELVLRLRVASKSSESVTRADSCLALVQLAALNAGMARTAALSERNLMAAPPPLPQLEPSPGLEATLPIESASALEGDSGAATPAGERGSRLWGLRPFVLGEVRTQSGMLPRQGWGQGVTAGVARGLASLRLSATLWQGQRGGFAPENVSEVFLDFQQQSLELSPCAGHSLSRALRLDGCALLTAHRVSTDEQGSRLIGSLGAAALASLTPWRGLRVELQGWLSAPFSRPMFGVQSDPYLYRPDAFQPGARIALGWEFGGDT